jgi:hypothetical protein
VPATRTDSAESEAASRQAVEAAWAKFWGVNTRLFAIPSSQIKPEIAAVAVDPTRKSTAVMRDCLDGSHSGTLSLTTGKKLTVGPARDNARATFVRDGAGVWRVQLVEYLLDVKC